MFFLVAFCFPQLVFDSHPGSCGFLKLLMGQQGFVVSVLNMQEQGDRLSGNPYEGSVCVRQEQHFIQGETLSLCEGEHSD